MQHRFLPNSCPKLKTGAKQHSLVCAQRLGCGWLFENQEGLADCSFVSAEERRVNGYKAKKKAKRKCVR